MHNIENISSKKGAVLCPPFQHHGLFLLSYICPSSHFQEQGTDSQLAPNSYPSLPSSSNPKSQSCSNLNNITPIPEPSGLTKNIKTRNLVQINRSFSQLLGLKILLFQNNHIEPYLDFPEPPNILLCSDPLYLERKKDQIERWLEIVFFRLDLAGSRDIIINFMLEKDPLLKNKPSSKKFPWLNILFPNEKRQVFLRNYKPISNSIEWDEDLFLQRSKHVTRLEKSFFQLKSAMDSFLVQLQDLFLNESSVVYNLKDVFSFNFIDIDQGYNSNDETHPESKLSIYHRRLVNNLDTFLSSQKNLNLVNFEAILVSQHNVLDLIEELEGFISCHISNLNFYTSSLERFDKTTLKYMEIDNLVDELSLDCSSSSPKLLKAKNLHSELKNSMTQYKSEFINMETRLNIETFYFEKFRYCILQKALYSFASSQRNRAIKNAAVLRKALQAIKKSRKVQFPFVPTSRIGGLMATRELHLFPQVESFSGSRSRNIGYYKTSFTSSLDASEISNPSNRSDFKSCGSLHLNRKNKSLELALSYDKLMYSDESSICSPLNPRYDYELRLEYFEDSLLKSMLAKVGLLSQSSQLDSKASTSLSSSTNQLKKIEYVTKSKRKQVNTFDLSQASDTQNLNPQLLSESQHEALDPVSGSLQLKSLETASPTEYSDRILISESSSFSFFDEIGTQRFSENKEYNYVDATTIR
ncbi:hypothetical protein BB560_000978 [Smittium megazygosporum]|uniref:PX domain-containing protein n=1 Tax=Smittium megazygosporum TaxID=133381 RepID=A0A2T9ZJ01_9FUNG|nr:hypothetical protein BB560_000978 [Smittium megazygosporum]